MVSHLKSGITALVLSWNTQTNSLQDLYYITYCISFRFNNNSNTHPLLFFFFS